MPLSPALTGPDASLAFRADPYGFGRRAADRLGTDVFRGRLMLRPVIFLRGAEAARLLYDETLFTRRDAVPLSIRSVLFGDGGVQGLDGAAHRARKAMLMSLMTPARLAALADEVRARLILRAGGRRRLEVGPLFRDVVAEAALAWAGLPDVAGAEAARVGARLERLFGHAGDLPSPGYLRARGTRRQVDRWAAEIVGEVRAGRHSAPAESALSVIATWEEPGAGRLPAEVAAVELLSVLRPTIAVMIWMEFLLHALVTAGTRPVTEAERRAFCQEVRRLYPFFPVIGARTRTTVSFGGYDLPGETRVLLDVMGTNRHRDSWIEPDRFLPERFLGAEPGPFEMVSQGGGGFETGHRCAGEWLTERLMVACLDVFLDRLDWTPARRDPRITRRAVPARVRGGLWLRDVREKG